MESYVDEGVGKGGKALTNVSVCFVVVLVLLIFLVLFVLLIFLIFFIFLVLAVVPLVVMVLHCGVCVMLLVVSRWSCGAAWLCVQLVCLFVCCFAAVRARQPGQ